MKLTHQVYLLLFVPMVCYLLSIGMILASFARVDEVARRETKAKKVISLCLEIDATVSRMVMLATAPRFFASQESTKSLRPFIASVSDCSNQLRELAKENQEAIALVKRYERYTIKLINDIKDLAGSYNGDTKTLFFSQYFDPVEYTEEIRLIISELQDCSRRLRTIYGNVSADFQPAAIKAREATRATVTLTILLNVLVICALAIAINKRSLQRLRTLMSNLEFFATGKSLFQPLKGTDELAELDRAILKMSEQRNRLDEIRKSMSAMVSHDLRAPLASMCLNLDIIEKAGVADPLIARPMQGICSEARRLQRLCTTFLDIERMEDGNLEVHAELVSCGDLRTPAIESVRSLADLKKITISAIGDDDALCWCDRDRTIQVLVNLLSNALKFCPEGSNIEIRSEFTASKSMRFSVIDQGPGIPPEKAGALFNKFSQLDQPSETKRQGSGLGLYICKMLIGAQHGTIGVLPRPEGGSCFWFELPAVTNCDDDE